MEVGLFWNLLGVTDVLHAILSVDDLAWILPYALRRWNVHGSDFPSRTRNA